jgi:hypothetical protein
MSQRADNRIAGLARDGDSVSAGPRIGSLRRSSELRGLQRTRCFAGPAGASSDRGRRVVFAVQVEALDRIRRTGRLTTIPQVTSKAVGLATLLRSTRRWTSWSIWRVLVLPRAGDRQRS